MVQVQTDLPPDRILRGAQHILYVEGDPDGVDRQALDVFFDKLVRVESLGPASNLRSVARAMRPRHPTWYFVIDRDHHSDTVVEASWRDFPGGDNLLIWRRRELENYFIDPDYLTRLRPCFASWQPKQRTSIRVSDDELRERVRKECQKRLYVEVVNQVIAECRGQLQTTWIECFPPGSFLHRDEAVRALREHPKFPDKRASFEASTQPDALERHFHEILDTFTAGADPLEYGKGRWLERVHGKPIWAAIVNDCFRIEDAAGQPLKAGRTAQIEVAKDLLRCPLAEQPEDLLQLRRLLEARVGAPSP